MQTEILRESLMIIMASQKLGNDNIRKTKKIYISKYYL